MKTRSVYYSRRHGLINALLIAARESHEYGRTMVWCFFVSIIGSLIWGELFIAFYQLLME